MEEGFPGTGSRCGSSEARAGGVAGLSPTGTSWSLKGYTGCSPRLLALRTQKAASGKRNQAVPRAGEAKRGAGRTVCLEVAAKTGRANTGNTEELAILWRGRLSTTINLCPGCCLSMRTPSLSPLMTHFEETGMKRRRDLSRVSVHTSREQRLAGSAASLGALVKFFTPLG